MLLKDCDAGVVAGCFDGEGEETSPIGGYAAEAGMSKRTQ